MRTEESLPRLAFRAGRWERGRRAVPSEVPVALVYNGTTQAVMMATPAALDDFALGFSLTEGIIGDPAEILETELVEAEGGIEYRMWLQPEAEARFQARRRAQVGPVGCGLCGIDSLAEALRPLPEVREARLHLTAADPELAMKGLMKHQLLNQTTRAVHAAGFYLPGQGVVLAREDVGRHNALDKLAGAMARAGHAGRAGVIVMTSRVSVDLIQKTAMIGASAVMAVSAPTTLAIAEAERAGLTLVGVLRGDEFEVFTHPQSFDLDEAADVA